MTEPKYAAEALKLSLDHFRFSYNIKSPPVSRSITERVEICRRHLDLLLQDRGERWGMNLMKKHFGWYIRGFPDAAKHRRALVTALELDEMKEELNVLEKDAKPV